VLSAAQQQGPFALTAHGIVSEALAALGRGDGSDSGVASGEDIAKLARSLHELNAAQHVLMISNAPSCRASVQLGQALVRIAQTWMEAERTHREEEGRQRAAVAVARALKLRGGAHGAVALGGLAALLDLPASAVLNAFIYTSARDLLSAAVRLNLIGPLAAVALQDEIVGTAAACSTELQTLGCTQAAGSAPLFEAAHACHDLLERRVFQT